MRLSNKRSLVTGAPRGSATPSPETFGREGAIVYIADVNEETGAAAEAKTARDGHQGHSCRSAFSLEADWQQAVKQIEDETGGLDILVNNAGINIRRDRGK